jgi:hypothetical protein
MPAREIASARLVCLRGRAWAAAGPVVVIQGGAARRRGSAAGRGWERQTGGRGRRAVRAVASERKSQQITDDTDRCKITAVTSFFPKKKLLQQIT